MQTRDADQKITTTDLDWDLVSEYQSSIFFPDSEAGNKLAPVCLLQTLGRFGLPARLVQNIETTLRKLFTDSQVQTASGNAQSPGRFRIYCQKKMIADVDATNHSRMDQTEPTTEPELSEDPPDSFRCGGWGFFLVERSNRAASLTESPGSNIDLYLYQEGE